MDYGEIKGGPVVQYCAGEILWLILMITKYYIGRSITG